MDAFFIMLRHTRPLRKFSISSSIGPESMPT